MANIPDLTLHGKPPMDNPKLLKGITLRRKEVSKRLTVHYSPDTIGFPDLNSKDTACGARSTEFTSTIVDTWPVVAGKEVTALWDQWPTAHKGPILQYMAACPSSTSLTLLYSIKELISRWM
jgi:hypothetical protein